MSATASSALRYWPEILWAGFAAANFAVLVLIDHWETVPFHFVWVSLTIVYGFRVWRLGATLLTLAVVCLLSTLTYGWLVLYGPQGPDELTEIPLMAAMFLAMVWHAQRRQAADEEVRKAAERERQFVRDASHQLKTPVAVARGVAELIRQGDSVASFDGDMADLVEELDRLAAMADSLLLLAAAEQPHGIERAPVEVEDLLVDAVRRWSHAAARSWQVDVMSEGILQGDRQRLDAVFDAILENAVQATSPGEVIAVLARADGDTAVIEVADSGVGIPEDVIPLVFDRFWSTRYGPDQRRGTGLGLPIVRAIVEAHGGSVAIRSTGASGTVVAVRLPGMSASRSGVAQGVLLA
jgi:two-component system OmpR family sensor kinase